MCAPDYNERRLPFRPAHLKQLVGLRDDGRVIAGGPEPDGRAAHIFYRVADLAALERLLAGNEFYRAGLFTAHEARAFVDLLEPRELLPFDAGLRVTLVEGRATDPARARAGLATLLDAGRIGFGGLLEGGAGLAVVRSPDAETACAWLADGGGWDRASLTPLPWSQTI